MSGGDRAIRVSTAVAVLGVAGIAAYVSYWHAYEVVRAHGESGVTARLEPATIDGLVYSSSMVVLYAARHRLAAPALARWLLALGVLATLAANMAHGWSHGPIGATVAAWPAASLVGSYELLLWLIRTAAPGAMVREPAAGHPGRPPDHSVDEPQFVAMADRPCPPAHWNGNVAYDGARWLADRGVDQASAAGRTSEPGICGTDQAYRDLDRLAVGRPMSGEDVEASAAAEQDVDAAAVAAYRSSLSSGRPLSERKLAATFGKTSRRWARNRMADARQPSVQAFVDGT